MDARRPPDSLFRADKDDPPVMATQTGKYPPHALVAPTLHSTAVLERELEALKGTVFDRQVGAVLCTSVCARLGPFFFHFAIFLFVISPMHVSGCRGCRDVCMCCRLPVLLGRCWDSVRFQCICFTCTCIFAKATVLGSPFICRGPGCGVRVHGFRAGGSGSDRGQAA